MPVAVSYPGVYVQEVPSGVRTITGVSTSIAMFIGMTRRGRMRAATRVLSFADYERSFGTDVTISEMTDQVRQFFLNSGREAFIMRIADATAAPARGDLRNEAGTVVMTLTAKDDGVDGNLIRVEVDYDAPSPEATFNLRAFRRVIDIFGVPKIETDETFSNLSMDPASGRFVSTIVNQQSTLINVSVPGGLVPGQGFSRSGILVDAVDNDVAATTLNGQVTATAKAISISVDGQTPVLVVLPPLAVPAPAADPLQAWGQAINTALTPVGAQITATLQAGPTGSRYVEFRSTKAAGGSVVISPAPITDATGALQLGVAQGGLEVGGHATLRPAPTGFFARFGGINAPNLTRLCRRSEEQSGRLDLDRRQWRRSAYSYSRLSSAGHSNVRGRGIGSRRRIVAERAGEPSDSGRFDKRQHQHPVESGAPASGITPCAACSIRLRKHRHDCDAGQRRRLRHRGSGSVVSKDRRTWLRTASAPPASVHTKQPALPA